ncbi:MAG: winged helix-turn-helix domain-containing protein [Paracoccaceae bacterium]
MAGEPVPLGARAFDVLAHLNAHADRVVTKQELLETVWGGLAVEEGNLTVQISALRKVLGAKAIATVPGVGYKLATGPEPAHRPVQEGPPLPEKPSLAVLPFANLTGRPDQDYLIDGIVADLASALNRVSGIFVISTTSSFAYKGRVVSLAEVGVSLGVRYILEGSIQQAGETLRITVQLTEAESGRNIWSDRFTGTTADIFDLQDVISEKTVAAIEPSLLFEESRRARAKPTASLQAYDLTLQAAPLVLRVSSLADFREADEILDRALALDPDYALAKALKVRAHVMAAGSRAISHAEGAAALPVARDLLDAHQSDPLVLAYAGHMMAYLGDEPEMGIHALETAKSLNPNSVLVRVSSGWINAYVGRYAEAIADFEHAYRINPLDPNLGHCRSGHGFSLFGLGDYAGAVSLLEKALADDPGFGTTEQALGAAYELAGRPVEAQRVIARYARTYPSNTIAYYLRTTPFRQEDFRMRMVAGLRAAGLPEG